MSDDAPPLDDLLDTLVAEFSDALARGGRPQRAAFLERVPAEVRPGLERVLKMVEAGVARPPSAAAPLAPGRQFGAYRLEHEIGRGGMALVWLAQDTELKRPVALKVLRPGLALEQRHVDRFRREALAIASLQHPHIVQVYGVGETEGYHWLAMEHVEGPSLATVLDALGATGRRGVEDLARAAGSSVLAQGAASYEQAVARLLAPVAEALAVAHEHGLVHRDVKPSNILLHKSGRAVIADFGLAKGDSDPALSLTGEGLGTPFYMSPEQAYVTTKTVDHRTDVYSLGVTLYEALSGRRPFKGDGFLEVLDAIRTTLPTPLRSIAPACTVDAAAVVRRAMAREPEQRYATAAALQVDLQALARGAPTTARADEGGPVRRLWAGVRQAAGGGLAEYRSERTLLGLPLVHWFGGPRRPHEPLRVAKGWLACGDLAVGVVAMGPRAVGGLAIGGVVVGVLAWGGVGVGVLAMGGTMAGLVAFGGLALGGYAFGGVAVGHTAAGGMAIGKYATGGLGIGEHVVDSARSDPVAVEYFDTLWQWVPDALARMFGG